MICRKIVDGKLVWFGSSGLNIDLTAKKTSNYASGLDGIVASLSQRLSVMNGELWYRRDQGIPLFDKHKNKNLLDVYFSTTIFEHPNIISIDTFESEMLATNSGKLYSLKFSVVTDYGDLALSAGVKL